MSDSFLLRYDGLDAEDHRMDMALLGRSLIGVDQAIHRGLWATQNPGVAQGRRRLDVRVQVEAPRAACVEVHGALAAAAGVLPFMHEVATTLGADYVKHLLSAVVLYHGGRAKDADQQMEKMLEIFAEQQRLQAADRIGERQTLERMHAATASAILAAVQSMQKQAQDIVAPVGPSAETLRIVGNDIREATVIDVAVADAVRSGERLEVGDMEIFKVRLDGLTKHNRAARVELPDCPGKYIAAEIRDPAFDVHPNGYTAAFASDEFIEVQAKPTRKAGAIVRLHLLNIVQN